MRMGSSYLTLALATSIFSALTFAAAGVRTANADAPIVFLLPASAPQLSSDTMIMFLNPTGNVVSGGGCSDGEFAEQHVVIIVPGKSLLAPLP